MMRRRRSADSLDSMELLLLVLIRHGVSTSYDFLSFFNLSVNSTSPRLKRLENAGLLSSIPGPRKRVDYEITRKGELLLEKGLASGSKRQWRFGEPHTFALAPRVLLLAWIHGGRGEARKCLDAIIEDMEAAIEDLRQRKRALSRDSSIAEEDPDRPILDIQRVYIAMDAECELSQLYSQRKALPEIESLLRKLPAPPSMSSRRDPSA